jgi:hypothetical protein
VARAYDALGHRLCWQACRTADTEAPAACDLERRDRAPHPALRALAPAGVDFWRFWVLGELAAKLADVPMLEWLRRFRSGCAPALPAGARALLVTGWERRWVLGFARGVSAAAGLGRAREPSSVWGFAPGRIEVWETEAAPRAGGCGRLREVL